MIGHLTVDRIWVSRDTPLQMRGRPALFLDRDGVLVEEVNYLGNPENVRLLEGAGEMLKWASREAVPVIVVTNQSAIDRGLFEWKDFLAVEQEIERHLKFHEAAIDLVVACPFHPDFTRSYGAQHAYWRKPGPGMFHLAAELLSITLEASWMIGDKESDISAARAAGLAGAIHVSTGHGPQHRSASLKHASGEFSVEAAETLNDALPIVSSNYCR